MITPTQPEQHMNIRQQRIHQKTGFQFIAIVAHDMAQIGQLGINLPRVRLEKRQKKNGIITPLMAMILVLLHPQQPVVCIAISLVKIRDNQNQKYHLKTGIIMFNTTLKVTHPTTLAMGKHGHNLQSWCRL